MLKNQNFTMYKGDSKNVAVTCTEDGSPLSLSGATIKYVLKRSVSATDQLIYKTTSDGITVADNVFTVSLGPTDTALNPGRYYHEAEVTDGFGNVSTVMVGEVTILASGV